MAVESNARACVKCAAVKPLDQYHADKNAPAGRSRRCAECAKAHVRAWSAANKERKAAAWREYRATNKERTTAYDKSWREKNADRYKENNQRYAAENSARHVARVKQWRIDNPERAAARRREEQATRRAKVRQAMPPWADRDKIKEVYLQAEMMGKETGIPHHVDHIIALSGRWASGLHVHTNMRVIPAVENVRKSNKEVEFVDGKRIPWLFLEGKK